MFEKIGGNMSIKVFGSLFVSLLDLEGRRVIK